MADDITAHAAAIVAAYVAHNALPPDQVPALIVNVHGALQRVEPLDLVGWHEANMAHLEPAVPIDQSVTPDYVVCLEDGKRFRSMRRHLTNLGLTPEAYRERWNLPKNWPIVAPNYAARRSELAKANGLGRKA